MGEFWRAVTGWWPMDYQTTISLTVGLVFTLLTFYLGYRKTIGAKAERARLASLDLAASVLRRIAVDRDKLSRSQYDSMRRAKAMRADINVAKLADVDSVLDLVLTDVIENPFLDAASKNSVIDLIQLSRDDDPQSTEEPSLQGSQEHLAFSVGFPLAVGAVAVGILSTSLMNYLQKPTEGAGMIESLFVPLFITAGIVAMVGTVLQTIVDRRRRVSVLSKSQLQTSQSGDLHGD